MRGLPTKILWCDEPIEDLDAVTLLKVRDEAHENMSKVYRDSWFRGESAIDITDQYIGIYCGVEAECMRRGWPFQEVRH